MPAYVYLLAHQSAPRFKIGKAGDVGARVRQLGAKRFDFGQSRALRVCDDAAAVNLERLLHRAFAKSRLASSDIVPLPGESTDGDSEWFSFDCKSRLDEFLAANQDLLDFEAVPDRDFKRMLPSARKPVARQPARRGLVGQHCKFVHAPPVAVDITSDVDLFLTKLSAFASVAQNLEFKPPQERSEYGNLLGSIPLDSGLDPQALFADLMDCSVRVSKWGAFRLVSGVTFLQDGRHVRFDLSVFRSSRLEASSAENCAAARLAAYPLPVPGWGPVPTGA
jgi:hypothetical protein